MHSPFTTTRLLNFGDCDVSGTAYFPAYLNILNGVNEEFWLHLGFPWRKNMLEERWGTPTVHISCDFSCPSQFGEELSFELRVVKVGKSSVTLQHNIHCQGEQRWSCRQILVASDLQKHQSMPWPPAVKAALEACLVVVDDTPSS